jgi:hypothetical protein
VENFLGVELSRALPEDLAVALDRPIIPILEILFLVME